GRRRSCSSGRSARATACSRRTTRERRGWHAGRSCTSAGGLCGPLPARRASDGTAGSFAERSRARFARTRSDEARCAPCGRAGRGGLRIDPVRVRTRDRLGHARPRGARAPRRQGAGRCLGGAGRRERALSRAWPSAIEGGRLRFSGRARPLPLHRRLAPAPAPPLPVPLPVFGAVSPAPAAALLAGLAAAALLADRIVSVAAIA